MKKIISLSILSLILSACWPVSVGFKDKAMPKEWVQFTVKTLENNAPNSPLSYTANLTEALKDGLQNNTRLKLASTNRDAQVQVEGQIASFSVTPVAIQAGDVAAKNRLTISVNFIIYITEPKEEEMKLTSSRFIDYDSDKDFSSVETVLLEEINKQIVQDVINKLYSNW